ncbi:DUF4390 domain-containing protein [Castellaniella sp.]|uniref:DUF4390 domain-containing protein n=1 Tax=Castellaniella sp. TaxID=1955812 RepID=UPI00355D6FCB
MSRRLLYVLIVLVALLQTGLALANGGEVTHVSLQQTGGQWMLDADIDIHLGDELDEAAHKGVPLYFTVDLQIERPRWWWFDETVVDEQRTWRIQYNPLTRQWRTGTGDLSLPTPNLDEALDQLRHIRHWAIGPTERFAADQTWRGRLRLRLDTARLARPLQVDGLNSTAWALTTPWKYFEFSTSADTHPE